jgi:hypothetical protein
MTDRREFLLIVRGLAVLMPGGLGWLINQAAAYLVQHSAVEIQLKHAGFGFLSNAAEMIYFLGPLGSTAAGLVFGLLGSMIYLRHVGSFLKAAAVNVLAAVILVCCAGAEFLFPLPALAALLFWGGAVIWVSVHSVGIAQPGASPLNGGPATALNNSGVTEGPPSVS